MNPNTIKTHYDDLRSKKLSPEKIAQNASLLNYNPKTIQANHDKLVSLGFSEQKIAQNASLLTRSPKTIQDNHDKLMSLGISEQKIAQYTSLLTMNPNTIKTHYANLRSKEISPEKIARNASLLTMNPKTLQEHYNYLKNVINLEVNKIQQLPSLLMFNPDAFAKKLRMFKLDTLGLKRNDMFNPNEYPRFYLSSPATLLVKKDFYIENKIDFRNNLLLLRRPWKRIFKNIDKALSDADAENEGRRITQPYKQRYDSWMREYKKWCSEYYLRRGRRLIIKV